MYDEIATSTMLNLNKMIAASTVQYIILLVKWRNLAILARRKHFRASKVLLKYKWAKTKSFNVGPEALRPKLNYTTFVV